MRNQRTHNLLYKLSEVMDQLGERSPSKREVVGSSLTRTVTFEVVCKANCVCVDFSIS